MGDPFAQRDDHIRTATKRAEEYREMYVSLLAEYKALIEITKKLAEENARLKNLPCPENTVVSLE